MTPDKIKEVLLKLCKNLKIPEDVIAFIDKNTMKYGTIKLFLTNNKYFLEFLDSSILEKKFA